MRLPSVHHRLSLLRLESSFFDRVSDTKGTNPFNINYNLIINHAKLSTREGHQRMAESSVG